MFICLIAGMIVGSVSAGCINFETLDRLNSVFLTDFKQRISQSGAEVFVSSLSLYFIFALILELSAFAVWGIISVPLLLVFKGIGMGLSGGYLYLVYGLKGIAFYILIWCPEYLFRRLHLRFLEFPRLKVQSQFQKKSYPSRPTAHYGLM